MNQPQQQGYRPLSGQWTVSRFLMLVACVLLVIAALMAGNVIFKGSDYVPWALGAFAAWSLSWVGI